MERPSLQGKYCSRIRFPVALILLMLPGLALRAQQSTPANSNHAAAHTRATALDDPLLQETDDAEVPTDLFSRVTLQYDHLMFASGGDGDRFRVSGQQTFGARHRLGITYELVPYFKIHGGSGANGDGLGDSKPGINFLLGKGKYFSHALRAEFTLPSASNSVVGLGQNIVKFADGASTPLSSRTVLNIIVAYNKGMTARPGQKGFNNLEPEVILAQEFNKSVAGFLDYDAYYDFNVDKLGQTLKGGLTIHLDRKGRWIGSPYAQFALNHFTSSTNLKSDLGFDLTFRY
jgi:hypothetical protein